MIVSTLYQFVKKNNFGLIFHVLLGLFISEHGFAFRIWDRSYVQVARNAQRDLIVITTVVYQYSNGPKIGYGYLTHCDFEASIDNKKYFKLMTIQTSPQYNSKITSVNFMDKLDKASITFTDNVITPGVGQVWPNHLGSNIKVEIPNIGERLTVVGVGWELNSKFRDVSYIRISGKWHILGTVPEYFRGIVYDLKKSNQYALKSNISKTTKKESVKDKVNILIRFRGDRYKGS